MNRPDLEVSQPAKQQDESASNTESTSNEDFRARVLKSAKERDRQAVDNHFKRENEFKTSLNPTQKSTILQSAESTVILEWMVIGHSDRKVTAKLVSKDQRKEKLCLLEKELAGLGKQPDPE